MNDKLRRDLIAAINKCDITTLKEILPDCKFTKADTKIVIYALENGYVEPAIEIMNAKCEELDLNKILFKSIDMGYDLIDYLTVLGADPRHDFDKCICAAVTAKNGNLALVNKLIDLGCSIDAYNNYPIKKAIILGNDSLFTIFVRHIKDMVSISRNQDFRLMYENLYHKTQDGGLMGLINKYRFLFNVRFDRCDSVKVMLEQNKVNLKDVEYNALKSAASRNNLETFALLDNAGFNIHINNEEMLSIACENHSYDVIQYIMEDPYLDIDYISTEDFRNICKTAPIDLIKIFVRRGVKPMTTDDIVVKEAVESGNVDLLNLFRYNGYSFKNYPYMYQYIKDADFSKVKMLLKLGFDATQENSKAVKLAALYSGSKSMVDYLLGVSNLKDIPGSFIVCLDYDIGKLITTNLIDNGTELIDESLLLNWTIFFDDFELFEKISNASRTREMDLKVLHTLISKCNTNDNETEPSCIATDMLHTYVRNDITSLIIKSPKMEQSDFKFILSYYKYSESILHRMDFLLYALISEKATDKISYILNKYADRYDKKLILMVLDFCIKNDDVKNLRRLIELTQVSEYKEELSKALFDAIMARKCSDIIRTLAEIDTSIINDNHLKLASMIGYVDIVESLLEVGANVENVKNKMFKYSTESANTELSTYLVGKLTMNVDKSYSTRYLLITQMDESKCDPHDKIIEMTKDSTWEARKLKAIYHAYNNDALSLTEMMADSNFDITFNDFEVLRIAIYCNSEDVIKLFTDEINRMRDKYTN